MANVKEGKETKKQVTTVMGNWDHFLCHQGPLGVSFEHEPKIIQWHLPHSLGWLLSKTKQKDMLRK